MCLFGTELQNQLNYVVMVLLTVLSVFSATCLLANFEFVGETDRVNVQVMQQPADGVCVLYCT